MFVCLKATPDNFSGETIWIGLKNQLAARHFLLILGIGLLGTHKCSILASRAHGKGKYDLHFSQEKYNVTQNGCSLLFNGCIESPSSRFSQEQVECSRTESLSSSAMY